MTNPNTFTSSGKNAVLKSVRAAIETRGANWEQWFDTDTLTPWQRTCIAWAVRHASLGLRTGSRADDACMHYFVGASLHRAELRTATAMIVSTRGAAEPLREAWDMLRNRGVLTNDGRPIIKPEYP